LHREARGETKTNHLGEMVEGGFSKKCRKANEIPLGEECIGPEIDGAEGDLKRKDIPRSDLMYTSVLQRTRRCKRQGSQPPYGGSKLRALTGGERRGNLKCKKRRGESRRIAHTTAACGQPKHRRRWGGEGSDD